MSSVELVHDRGSAWGRRARIMAAFAVVVGLSLSLIGFRTVTGASTGSSLAGAFLVGAVGTAGLILYSLSFARDAERQVDGRAVRIAAPYESIVPLYARPTAQSTKVGSPPISALLAWMSDGQVRVIWYAQLGRSTATSADLHPDSAIRLYVWRDRVNRAELHRDGHTAAFRASGRVSALSKLSETRAE